MMLKGQRAKPRRPFFNARSPQLDLSDHAHAAGFANKIPVFNPILAAFANDN